MIPAILKSKPITKDSFLSELVKFGTQVRLQHWAALDLSCHLAFGELYDNLTDVTDQLVEISQTEELIKFDIKENVLEKDGMKMLSDMFNFIETNRSVFKFSHEQNIVDTIQDSINKTRYKLKFLK